MYGVNNTIESTLSSKENVTVADIRKELFEGDTVEEGSAVKDALDRGLFKEENIKITEKKED